MTPSLFTIMSTMEITSENVICTGEERDEIIVRPGSEVKFVILHFNELEGDDDLEIADGMFKRIWVSILLAEAEAQYIRGTPLPGGRSPAAIVRAWEEKVRAAQREGRELDPFGPEGIFTPEELEALQSLPDTVVVHAAMAYYGGEIQATAKGSDISWEDLGKVIMHMGFGKYSLRKGRSAFPGDGSVSYEPLYYAEMTDADMMMCPYEGEGEEWLPEERSVAVVVSWEGDFSFIYSRLMRGIEIMRNSQYAVGEDRGEWHRPGMEMDRRSEDFLGDVCRMINISGYLNMWMRLSREDIWVVGMYSHSAVRRIPVVPEGGEVVFDTYRRGEVMTACLILHRKGLNDATMARMLDSFAINVVHYTIFKRREGGEHADGEHEITTNCRNSSWHTDLAAHFLACRDRGEYAFAVASIGNEGEWDDVVDVITRTRCTGPSQSEVMSIWVENHRVGGPIIEEVRRSYGDHVSERVETEDKMYDLRLYCVVLG